MGGAAPARGRAARASASRLRRARAGTARGALPPSAIATARRVRGRSALSGASAREAQTDRAGRSPGATRHDPARPPAGAVPQATTGAPLPGWAPERSADARSALSRAPRDAATPTVSSPLARPSPPPTACRRGRASLAWRPCATATPLLPPHPAPLRATPVQLARLSTACGALGVGRGTRHRCLQSASGVASRRHTPCRISSTPARRPRDRRRRQELPFSLHSGAPPWRDLVGDSAVTGDARVGAPYGRGGAGGTLRPVARALRSDFPHPRRKTRAVAR